MKIINLELLNNLTDEAKQNPRLRKNLNFHSSFAEPSQRLLNAMEPGSYIRPHRHLFDPKPECFIGIRGRFVLFIFDNDGVVEKVIVFGPNEAAAGAEIPVGVWHTVVSLENGSVFFETKQGPFNPINKNDFAPWAPEEGSKEAFTYLQSLVSLVQYEGSVSSTAAP